MSKQSEFFPSQEGSTAIFNAQKNDDFVRKQIRKARIITADRSKQRPIQSSIDDIIPKTHLARDVWNYVNSLDLTVALGNVKSVEGNSGRPAIDPKILLTLWLFATLKGIVSARRIDEYCKEHSAYIWICGDVNVNYHTISDFRNKGLEQLDLLLTQSVKILSKKKSFLWKKHLKME